MREVGSEWEKKYAARLQLYAAGKTQITNFYGKDKTEFLLHVWHVRVSMLIYKLHLFWRCLAPEYFTHGVVDEKTDVFAFGVFLLEIITGRKPVDGTHKSLLSWVRNYLSLALSLSLNGYLKGSELWELRPLGEVLLSYKTNHLLWSI